MNHRLQVLFVVALLGVLAVFGTVSARLGGWPLAVGYAVAVVALLSWAARRARARQESAAAGRSCSCCTSTVYDAVQVR